MSKTQKKKGKKIIIGLIIIVVLIVAAIILLRPKGQQYDEEIAKVGDITTYFSFTGDVENINTQNQVSKKTITIYDVLVKEGDVVKEGDTIIETTAGEKVKSTINGEVTKIYVEEDDQVMSGGKLFDIVDYNNLQITVKVDEYDLSSIQIDKQVDVTINSLAKQVKGTISEISKEATSTNGVSYFTAKIKLEQDSEIKVGMSTEIKVLNKNVMGVILVSMDAIQTDTQNKPYVYIKDENGVAVQKYIETGVSNGLFVEVKSGLSENEIVLTPVVEQSGIAAMQMGSGGGTREGVGSNE